MTQTKVPASTVAKATAGAPRRGRSTMQRLLLLTIIFLVFFVTLFPFYWMLRTALSNGKSLPSNPSSLLPADFTLGAFKRVLGFSTVEQAQAEGGSGAD